MDTVFLEGFYAFLLLVHTFTTFVLIGAMTHNLVCVASYLRGRFGRQKLEWRYLKVSLWSYIITYIFGVLVYPAFRVYIRGGEAGFDKTIPWATGLFEVKEHWGAIGLALMVVYYFLRKNFNPQAEREKLLYFYAPLCVFLNVILWYKVTVGCYLTLLKGSWS